MVLFYSMAWPTAPSQELLLSSQLPSGLHALGWKTQTDFLEHFMVVNPPHKSLTYEIFGKKYC